MNNSNVSRRSFLKKAGKTSGFIVLAGGAVQLSSFNAWAAKKSAIDNHVAKKSPSNLVLLSTAI